MWCACVCGVCVCVGGGGGGGVCFNVAATPAEIAAGKQGQDSGETARARTSARCPLMKEKKSVKKREETARGGADGAEG